MFQEHSRNFGYFYLVKIKLVLNAKKNNFLLQTAQARQLLRVRLHRLLQDAAVQRAASTSHAAAHR